MQDHIMPEEPAAPASEEQRLEEGVKQIIVTRERTPRSPTWNSAWWRTLVRYNHKLATLRQQEPPASADSDDTPAR